MPEENNTAANAGKDQTDQNAESVGADTQTAGADNNSRDDKTQETFTAAEVQNMIDKALGKKLSKMPSKEDLAAFKDWQAAKQKEAPKETASAPNGAQDSAKQFQEQLDKRDKEFKEELDKINSALEQVKREKEKAESIELLRKADIEERYFSFVGFEVSKMAQEEEISFNEALDKFIKKYPNDYKKQAAGRTVVIGATDGEGSAKRTVAPKAKFNIDFIPVRPLPPETKK